MNGASSRIVEHQSFRYYFCMYKFIVAFFIIWSSGVWAQEEPGAENAGANIQYEGGAIIGSLLPNQISGVTEIMGLGGARVGYRLNSSVIAEAGAVMGNGHGAQYKDMFMSFRVDVPVENLVGILYVGPDLVYFKGNGNPKDTMQIGGHVGGGILAHAGGSLWVRTDMKFNVKPGTSMYLSLSLMFRFGDSGGGGN